jgi:uncharacterized membrane protein YtjA (UPF0391 family)
MNCVKQSAGMRRYLVNVFGEIDHDIIFFKPLKTQIMLRWTVIFIVLAIIAAIFGFGGIAAGAASIAKILFFIFLVLFIISLFMGKRKVL